MVTKNQLKSQNQRFAQAIFPFQNRLKYWNVDKQLISALNVATWCTNLLRFSEVTPEKLLLVFVLLQKNPKIGISGDYLRTYLTDFDKTFSFDSHVGGDD